MTARRRTFGSIRRLPGGTFQARYVGPNKVRYTRGETFTNVKDAGRWLDQVKANISLDTWKPPTERPQLNTFGLYAAAWVEQRELAPRSRIHYQQLRRDHILPRFEHVRLRET
ncbi:MAG: hypothetical protein ACR2KG_11395 [Nocardioidaceae bacterium]